jgi:hypothetical protein
MTRAGPDQRSTFGEADLALIEGIDRLTAERLILLGVKSFADIAAWTKADVERWRTRLGLDDRIDTDSWIAQAAKLAIGTETAYAGQVRRGEITPFAKPAARKRRRTKSPDQSRGNGKAAAIAQRDPANGSLMQRLSRVSAPPASMVSAEPTASPTRRAAFRGIIEEATVEIIRHTPTAPPQAPSTEKQKR